MSLLMKSIISFPIAVFTTLVVRYIGVVGFGVNPESTIFIVLGFFIGVSTFYSTKNYLDRRFKKIEY